MENSSSKLVPPKKKKRRIPTPGIEPGPPGWKPGILTTRPNGKYTSDEAKYLLLYVGFAYTHNNYSSNACITGASLSEPHINRTAVRELCMVVRSYVSQSAPYHCTEAARNVIHCKICVLKTRVQCALGHLLNQQKLGEIVIWDFETATLWHHQMASVTPVSQLKNRERRRNSGTKKRRDWQDGESETVPDKLLRQLNREKRGYSKGETEELLNLLNIERPDYSKEGTKELLSQLNREKRDYYS